MQEAFSEKDGTIVDGRPLNLRAAYSTMADDEKVYKSVESRQLRVVDRDDGTEVLIGYCIRLLLMMMVK